MEDTVKQASEILSKVIDSSVIDNAIDSSNISIQYTEEDIKKIEGENESLKSKVFELENKLSESEKKYLYLLADLENIKKRYNTQILDFKKYEGENVLKDVIEFLDYLKLKIVNTDNEHNGRLIEIENQVYKLLNIFDVKPIYEIRPVYFNDEYDEAVFSIDTDDKDLDNSIASVLKQGFKFKDKILRYEQVSVNKFKE